MAEKKFKKKRLPWGPRGEACACSPCRRGTRQAGSSSSEHTASSTVLSHTCRRGHDDTSMRSSPLVMDGHMKPINWYFRNDLGGYQLLPEAWKDLEPHLRAQLVDGYLQRNEKGKVRKPLPQGAWLAGTRASRTRPRRLAGQTVERTARVHKK